jgi:DNA-binding winged helix-turn-helix (wHTH) protein
MIYCIGACTIDTQTYEVRLGGRPTSVEPQVFDLLLLLVTNRHRVVTKDEIIKQIWNGRIVSEDTLSSRIRAARKAIGDDGKAQRLIQTIQRRGFRFVGSVAGPPRAYPLVPARRIAPGNGSVVYGPEALSGTPQEARADRHDMI